jgi:hypothetical protein
VEDRVTYRLPGGPLGAALDGLGASAQIDAAFTRRAERIRALLG